MKQAISFVLAVVIIITVLYTIPLNKEFDLRYVLNAIKRVGDNPVPSLTGGHSFDKYDEAGKALVYIVSYPLRFVFYVISQSVKFISYLFPKSLPYTNSVVSFINGGVL